MFIHHYLSLHFDRLFARARFAFILQNILLVNSASLDVASPEPKAGMFDVVEGNRS